jgi:hypothetical protein
VWERGGPLSPGRRALALLATATGEGGLEWRSIGGRDADLLSLRERLFGPHVTAVVACPSCGERRELSFGVDDVRASPPEPGPELSVTVDGVEARFRLPTTADLDDLDGAADGDVDAAADDLLRRCVLAVSGDGQLAAPLVAAIEERMAAADPQADVQLALCCDGCGTAWDAPFDIAAFLWSEVDAWAWRLVAEVDQLARTYGWTERDVLALSPQRRRIYLEVAAR